MGKEQSKDARVGELDWSNRKLQKLPTEELIRVSAHEYKVFNVSHNALSSLDGVHVLKSLRRLNASRNHLSQFNIELLPRLESLNLSFNKLTSLPSPLASVTQLKELILSNNNIKNITEEIQSLESLTFLDLSHNQITRLPDSFGSLVSLETLYLNNNRISTEGCKLGELYSLRMIDLSGNQLTELPDMIFLASIQKLYLNHNMITELSSTIAYLPKLKEISLRGNKLKSLPKDIANNVCLTLLDLEDNLFPHAEVFATNNVALMMQYLYGTHAEKQEAISKSKQLLPSHPSVASSHGALSNTVHLSVSEVGLNRKNFDEPKVEVVAYTKRLFWIKGLQEFMLVQKVPVKHNSLNVGDCFVFDIGKKVFVWEGSESNPYEKAKAEYWASLLASELGGAALIVLDAGLCEDSPLLPEGFAFWDELGGKGKIKSAEEGGNDELVPLEILASYQLYSVIENDTDSRCDVVLISNGLGLSKEMLNSAHCFVLDCQTEIFVWAGMESTGNEKSWALLKAEELESQSGRSSCCTVSWIMDRDEMLFFREQFPDWSDPAWITLLKRTKHQKALDVADVMEYDKVLTRQMKDEEKRIAKGETYEDRKKKKANSSSSAIKRLSRKITTTSILQPAVSAKEKPKEIQILSQPIESESVQEDSSVIVGDSDKSASELAASVELSSSPAVLPTKKEKVEKPQSTYGKRRQVRIPAAFADSPGKTILEDKPAKEKRTEKTKSNIKTVEEEKPIKVAVEKELPTAVTVAEQQKKTKRSEEMQSNRKMEEEKPTKTVAEKPATQKESHKKDAKSKLKETKVTTSSSPIPEKKEITSSPVTKAITPVETKTEPTATHSKTSSPKKQRKVKLPNIFTSPTESVDKEIPVEPAKEKIVQEEEDPSSKKKTPSRLARLKGPLKGPSRTSRATRNPVKDRARKEKEDEDKRVGPEQAQQAARRNAAAGAYGMLWALGVDTSLFEKRQERREKAPPPKTTKPPHLYHVKGRRRVFIREVEVSYTSLNSGDVFILDNGERTLYMWNGTKANRIEKGSALDFAKKLKDKYYFGNANIVTLEEGKTDGSVSDFWALLGHGNIKSPEAGGEDNEAAKLFRDCVKLFRVEKSEDENVELVLVGDGPYPKETLDTNHCFIMDCMTEIYPWTGKKANIKLRQLTVKKGKEMAAERPFWVAEVDRQLEGGESVLFKERFTNWSSGLPITVAQVAVGTNTAKVKLTGKVDVSTLHTKASKKEEVMIDDASGEVKIWRIEDFEKVLIDSAQYGFFYSGESYIVLYKYIWKNKDCFIIYYYQGRDSSINEKGTSAVLTIELDKEVSGMAKEIRVVQYKEPKHFLKLFQDKMVIHAGKSTQREPNSSALYQIRSYSNGERGVQCHCRASSLNPMNTFVLAAGGKFFVWFGKFSPQGERDFALQNKLLQGKESDIIRVEQHKEPAEFWKAIGGKGEYPYQNMDEAIDPRLFHCSLGTGTFGITEIIDYSQDDLSTHDTFILDALVDVFVWFGRRSAEKEQRWTMEATLEYVKTSPVKRKRVSVWRVMEGEEPYLFTTHFHSWMSKKHHEQKNGIAGGLEDVHMLLEQFSRRYTYEELRSGKFSKALDTANIEQYLEDSEFEEVFKMTREDFATMPAWKQTNLKKSLGLF